MKEIRFHCAHRRPDDLGNLIVRQVVIDPQHQRRSLLSREFGDGGTYFGRAFAAQQPHVRAFGANVGLIGDFKRRPFLRARPEPVQADIDANPIQPGAERRVALEAVQPAICANEHVLREIAGVFVIACESIAQLIDVALMPFDDDVERLAVAT